MENMLDPHKEFACNPVSEFASILMLRNGKLECLARKAAGGGVSFEFM